MGDTRNDRMSKTSDFRSCYKPYECACGDISLHQLFLLNESGRGYLPLVLVFALIRPHGKLYRFWNRIKLYSKILYSKYRAYLKVFGSIRMFCDCLPLIAKSIELGEIPTYLYRTSCKLQQPVMLHHKCRRFLLQWNLHHTLLPIRSVPVISIRTTDNVIFILRNEPDEGNARKHSMFNFDCMVSIFPLFLCVVWVV